MDLARRPSERVGVQASVPLRPESYEPRPKEMAFRSQDPFRDLARHTLDAGKHSAAPQPAFRAGCIGALTAWALVSALEIALRDAALAGPNLIFLQHTLPDASNNRAYPAKCAACGRAIRRVAVNTRVAHAAGGGLGDQTHSRAAVLLFLLPWTWNWSVRRAHGKARDAAAGPSMPPAAASSTSRHSAQGERISTTVAPLQPGCVARNRAGEALGASQIRDTATLPHRSILHTRSRLFSLPCVDHGGRVAEAGQIRAAGAASALLQRHYSLLLHAECRRGKSSCTPREQMPQRSARRCGAIVTGSRADV
ncbi:hypothetical protein NA57DRAFT_52171 [Rhizodiscina lignyota]|uniref:Uncharacterized protein n=1 Tax=Rhizodiscina lignyota TaxID=1504668 RepID=A0A9P4M9X5_9PEZI|nr:hypothetical protein NA57DRAFT_52171 [Rhizodiscina lignyota]